MPRSLEQPTQPTAHPTIHFERTTYYLAHVCVRLGTLLGHPLSCRDGEVFFVGGRERRGGRSGRSTRGGHEVGAACRRQASQGWG
eukprot:750459-Rhodomonas_salina.1